MAGYTKLVRFSRVILLGLGFFAAFAVAAAWDDLPAQLASHFDSSGRADGYMSRESFFATLGVVFALVLGMFLCLPAFLRNLPNGAINLPHRDYWLAPERRAQSLARLALWFHWYAIATAALLVLTVWLTLRANIARTGLDMSACTTALGLYVASCLVPLVGIYRQFGKLPSTG